MAEPLNDFEEHFRSSFDNYFEPLCRYAYSIVRDKDDARDRVQEVFIKWWGLRTTIAGPDEAKKYLYAAVYRHCLNDVRNKKVARKREENYQQTQSAETAFIDLAAVQELDSAIQLAIENLHPQCKAIFCKSRFESMTYAEIATSMNLSVKTIENQMGRALKLLREKVGSR